MYRKYVIMFALCLFVFSCSKKGGNTESSVWNGGIIKTYGLYKTDDEKVTIIVSEEPKGILKYVAEGPDGTVLFSSNQASDISVYQRWRLYWDSANDYLWVCSSDIGDFVWIKQEVEKYQIQKIKGSIYTEIIPEPLLLELSSTSQKWYYNQKKK